MRLVCFAGRQTNSQYFSALAPARALPYPDVTVQMTVFKENLEKVVLPSILSLQVSKTLCRGEAFLKVESRVIIRAGVRAYALLNVFFVFFSCPLQNVFGVSFCCSKSCSRFCRCCCCCLKKNQNAPKPSEHKKHLGGIKPWVNSIMSGRSPRLL